jgi:hypothetical protein
MLEDALLAVRFRLEDERFEVPMSRVYLVIAAAKAPVRAGASGQLRHLAPVAGRAVHVPMPQSVIHRDQRLVVAVMGVRAVVALNHRRRPGDLGRDLSEALPLADTA